MNETKYRKLMEKLNSTIQKYSPDSVGLVESNDFTNLNITKEINVQDIPVKQLPLVHVKLHTFYANGNGKGLTPKDIISIHNKVADLLEVHNNFDKLDNIRC